MFSKIKNAFKPQEQATVKIVPIDDFYEEHQITTKEKENGKDTYHTVKIVKTKQSIIDAVIKAIKEQDEDALTELLAKPFKGIDEIEPLIVVECTKAGNHTILIQILKAIENANDKQDDLFLLVGVNSSTTQAPLLDTVISFFGMSNGVICNKLSKALPDLINNGCYDMIDHIYKFHHAHLLSFEIEQLKDLVELRRSGIESAISKDDRLTQEEKDIQLKKALSVDGLNISKIIALINSYQSEPPKNTTGRPSAVELRKLNKTMPDYLKIKLM
jgi:hypothetical protein